MGLNLKKKLKKVVKKVAAVHTKPVKLAVAVHKAALPESVVSAVEKIEQPLLRNIKRSGGFVRRAGRKGFKGAAGIGFLNTAAVPITHPKEHAITGAVAGGAYYAGAASASGAAGTSAGSYTTGASAAAVLPVAETVKQSLAEKAVDFGVESAVVKRLAKDQQQQIESEINQQVHAGQVQPGQTGDSINPVLLAAGGLAFLAALVI